MPRDEDFIHFKLGENRDPQSLRRVLSAHFHYERLRNTRRFFMGVLAFLGAGLWLLTVWPGAISRETRSVILQLWGLCTLATLIFCALEFKWYRRRARLMRKGASCPHERNPSP